MLCPRCHVELLLASAKSGRCDVCGHSFTRDELREFRKEIARAFAEQNLECEYSSLITETVRDASGEVVDPRKTAHEKLDMTVIVPAPAAPRVDAQTLDSDAARTLPQEDLGGDFDLGPGLAADGLSATVESTGDSWQNPPGTTDVNQGIIEQSPASATVDLPAQEAGGASFDLADPSTHSDPRFSLLGAVPSHTLEFSSYDPIHPDARGGDFELTVPPAAQDGADEATPTHISLTDGGTGPGDGRNTSPVSGGQTVELPGQPGAADFPLNLTIDQGASGTIAMPGQALGGQGPDNSAGIAQTIESNIFDSATVAAMAKVAAGKTPAAGNPTPPQSGSVQLDSAFAGMADENTGGTWPERSLAATFDSAEVTGSQGAAIAKMWRGTIEPTTTPRMTIRRDARKDSPKDSKLVIKPKEFARKPARALKMPPLKTNADYELLDIIGEGGVGVVYSARQASIDRTVALKMLKPSGASNTEQREKFLSEAVVTGDLDHPNIVPIYDLGTNEAGALFYSMKKVIGTPWNKVITTKSLAENLDILMKVADAVAFAHARGIIHRDLKPENIMLGEFGEALVMDWGLAMATSNFRKVETITQTTSMGGTPAYMAPEMAAGPLEKVGFASDIYLLGAMLYEILTGKPPHSGKTVMQCLMAAARNEIVPTDQAGELVEIARRAMSTKIDARYASVRDFQNALREYESHAESIALVQRAEQGLAEARDSGDYQTYSKALFGYQEAHALWPENDKAETGIRQAQLAYAEAALAKQDFDLADSLLVTSDPTQLELKQRVAAEITERNARRQRLQMARRVLWSMGTAIAILIVGGLLWVNAERQKAVVARDEAVSAKKLEEVARKDADKQRIAAETQRKLAEAKKLEAEQAAAAERIAKQKALESAEAEKLAKKKAEESQLLAEKAEQAAIKDKMRAEEAEKIAVKEKQRAVEAEGVAIQAKDAALMAKEAEEYSGYIAKIGLASAKVQENAFGDVLELLEQCPPQYRNWEWRRLRYLCQRAKFDYHLKAEPPVAGVAAEQSPLAIDPRLPAELDVVALSPDGQWLAAAGYDAKIYIWQIGKNDQPARVFAPGGQYIHALAWSPDGAQLAVGGNDPAGGHLKLLNGTTGDIIQKIPGHTDAVLSVQFSRDGKKLLSSGYDNTARISDLDGTSQARVLRGHSWWVWSADWSPDGNYVVTASQDGTCIVWDLRQSDAELQQPQNRRLFRAHAGPVYHAAFSPDGNSVASGGYDQRVLIWRRDAAQAVDLAGLATGSAPATVAYRALAGHLGPVRWVGFFPDETARVLSASQDNTLKVWNAESGETIQTIRGHSGRVAAADFLPRSGEVVSASHDRRVKQWDLAGYREERVLQGKLLTGHSGALLGGDITPAGDAVVTASQDRTAKIWNTGDGALLQTLTEGHSFLVTNLALFPDGKAFATAAVDNTTRVWDLESGVERLRLVGTGQTAIVAVNSTGEFLATAGEEAAEALASPLGNALPADAKNVLPVAGAAILRPIVQVWDAANGNRLKKLFGHRGQVSAVAFAPHANWLASGDTAGQLIVWDLATGEPLWKADRHADNILGLAWSPDGKWLYSASADHTVGCADGRTGTEARDKIWRHDAELTAFALSADGTWGLTATVDGTVRVWNPETGKARSMLESAAGRVTSLAINADNTRALVISSAVGPAGGTEQPAASPDTNSSRVRLYDLATGGELPNLERSEGLIWSAIFGPQANSLLTVGGNGARLWKLGQPQPIMTFTPHGAVSVARFAPDAQHVLTGSWDNTLKLWNRQTGQPLRKLPLAHTGPINDARFAAEGNLLLTVADDGTGVVWDVPAYTVRQKLNAENVRLRAGVILPGGGHALTAGNDGRLSLWDIATGSQVESWQLSTAPLTSLAVQKIAANEPKTPSVALLVAIGGADNTAWLADLSADHPEKLRVRCELRGHTAAVTSVALSTDGRRVLTGSADTTVKLWDTRVLAPLAASPPAQAPADQNAASPRGKEILTLSGHTQEVTSVQFSADDGQVFTTSRDGTGILWLAE